jgi:hypothetical protein
VKNPHRRPELTPGRRADISKNTRHEREQEQNSMAEDEQATAKPGPAGKPLEPFTVEFSTPTNQTVVINTLRIRMRGNYSLAKYLSRPEGARDIGPMARMPEIPGQRMTVDHRRMKAVVEDPLEDNAELLRRINAVQRSIAAVNTGGDMVPVKRQELRLNPDTLKTLVCEILRKNEAKMVVVTGGRLPTPQQAAALDGRELFDPNSNNQRRPKYADQADEYYEQIEQQIS